MESPNHVKEKVAESKTGEFGAQTSEIHADETNPDEFGSPSSSRNYIDETNTDEFGSQSSSRNHIDETNTSEFGAQTSEKHIEETRTVDIGSQPSQNHVEQTVKVTTTGDFGSQPSQNHAEKMASETIVKRSSLPSQKETKVVASMESLKSASGKLRSHPSLDYVEETPNAPQSDKSIPIEDNESGARKQQSQGKDARHSLEESKLIRPDFLKGANLDTCLMPFHLSWSFGMEMSVPILNLSTSRTSMLYYVASHAAVLYNSATNDMKLLQGHKNLISATSVDDSGRWLVSADKGEDNTIIVWDATVRVPANTIFDPHPNCGTCAVAISGNAKYLVSIGDEDEPVFNLWLWTYGRDKPDGSYTFDAAIKSPIVRVCFDPNVQEHIMVAFQKQVVFLQWDSANEELLPPVFPLNKHPTKVGLITDCTYINACHQCVASCNRGHVLVFGTTIYAIPFEEAPVQNEKIQSKVIRISSSSVNCIRAIDKFVVTGDANGLIKFYDKQMKILFWCQNFELPPICSISFNLEERHFNLKDARVHQDTIPELSNNWESYEDRAQEYEDLYAQLVPSDATLQRLPFIVRDFVIATNDGRIAYIDYVHNKCSFLFRKADAHVGAIDAHSEKPFLVVGYANGSVRLYNYVTHEMLAEKILPEEGGKQVAITDIKYSPKCLHLACGRKNGSIWFLDPVSLTTKMTEPFRWTREKVVKMTFSFDSQYFVYYDANSTVVLFKYCREYFSWELLGKVRSHYKPINDILFGPYLPSRLFTIGEDRYLVEYNLEDSGYGTIELTSRERIDQTAIPICFTYYPIAHNPEDKYLFISDNQFKFKLLHHETLMCRTVLLGPAYGCYRESFVRKLLILPKHEHGYAIFCNDSHIGIQMIPTDGNPYKYIGTIGHPLKILDFCTSYDGQFVFTIGENDSCVLAWQVNVLSVQLLSKIGGVNLEPFFCLIEGGTNGWLFREMLDLFYYMQILHQGENTVLPRIVTDKIPASELPDLMRACGYYPSDYEIENMIVDVKYQDYDKRKVLKGSVTFFDFVKLYINHRPAHGISLQTFNKNFETFTKAGDGPRGTIDCLGFVNTICEKGEMFDVDKAYTCLTTLMRVPSVDVVDDDEPQKDFSFMPQEVHASIFLQDILGMDLSRSSVDEETTKTQEEEDSGSC